MMDDGYGGDYTLVYNGMNYPNVFKYTVTGLSTGLTYYFTLQALNFNGASLPSTADPFIICVKPRNFNPPTLS